jgi:hypothetical protein
MRVLLHAGANVNVYSCSGAAFLNTMIRTGCVEIVAAVLEEGRNTKLEFNWDLNPLQVMALLLREGQYSQDGRIVAIARMLLKAGARPNTGQPTPLMLVDTEWKCHFHSSRRYGRQKLSEPLKLNRRMEPRIFSFGALLKVYGAPAHGVPGVAGTRLLKLQEVLEKELVERQLTERVAESGS